jgi:hypothetical protein
VAEETTETKPISTIEDAVESIVAPSEEPTEEVTAQATGEVTDETAQEVEASAETETEEVVEEEEVLEASESEDDEDQEEDAGLEEPELYSVKVDGQEAQVTLEDLKQGYSGQKYVQSGMQDVAAKRKEAEDVYTALNNERAQIAQIHQQLQNGGVSQPPTKPNKELFEADPIGYMQENLDYEEKKANWDKQMAQLQHVSQQNSVAQQSAQQAFLREQMQILQKDIPEFADEKTGQKLKDKLVSIGVKHYGYSNAEIEQITDHRAINVLNDARKYQDIKAGKSKAEVKTKGKKPVVKPGAKKMATPNAKVRSRQQAKLRKTGNMEDAISLITNV